MRKGGILTGVALAVVLGGGVAVYWPGGDPGPVDVVQQITALAPAQKAPFDAALELAHRARDRFAQVRDYRCTYLRDERIDDQLQENHLDLKVRHEPFSVAMKWVAPPGKKDRQAVFVRGKNDGKMLVRGILPWTLKLDPKEAVERKESLHSIEEAGLKHAIERCCTAWEAEKPLNVTAVTVQDAELKGTLGDGRTVTRPCHSVTLVRDPAKAPRQTLTFGTVRVYFDRETHLPVRLETFGYAPARDGEGVLEERYTYLEMQTNVGLTDADFK
jgi:hypothetical protein